ncbi:MAG TPA: type II secretion system F family protein [Candidatus Sulfomarinibacteraceae bacterium]|nr:type II secretion system F family protein [Candidatus Sulfomarinibacteraceae bacterium]
MSPLILLAVGIALLMMFGAGIALLTGGRGEVEERMQQFVVGGEVEAIDTAELDMPRPDMADRLDEALSDRGFFEPIRKRIATADLKLRVSEYIILQVLAAFVLAGVAHFIFSLSIIIVAVLFIVGLRVPRMYIGYAASKRLQAFENQLSDTLNLWVNALRSGYSVLQGMEAIATELPAPVSREFERVVQEVRLGLSLEQALANMLRRVPSEDLDLIITAVNIQREVGGNLAEILDVISHTIRERVRIKGEIRTLTAQGRLTGWIISLLPIGLGAMLYSINPEYGSQLIVNEEPYIIPGVLPCGWLVLGVGGFMILMGALAVRKIVDIEV